jgi:peroxiredoxin
MKKTTKLLSLFAVFLSPLAVLAAVSNMEKAPDFTLQDVKGNSVSLRDYAGKVVVLEWINPGCPFVRKFYDEKHMGQFQKKADGMGVVWLSINSTNPDHRDYLTPEASLAWATEHGHAATWLMDPDGSVGKAYGAQTTPHMYIINKDGVVVYQGAIDSIRDTKPASIPEATNYVMEVLAAMDADQSRPHHQTRPYGCSVKY